tara:strand:- start:3350 stop:4786 length:1437 start_codon:yes stop_codon:yes gene_type:complete
MLPSFPIILIFSITSYFSCLNSARKMRSSGIYLHSSAQHHAWFGFLAILIPSALFLIGIFLIENYLINSLIEIEGATLFNSSADFILLKERVLEFSNNKLSEGRDFLFISSFAATVSYLFFGLGNNLDFGSEALSVVENTLVYSIVKLRMDSNLIELAIGLTVSIVSFYFSLKRISSKTNSRDKIEFFIKVILFGCSLIAVMTTIGIVVALVSETTNFLKMYPLDEFLFGTVWNPQFRGGGALGVLPLLWGTLYVSFIALLLSVPVGLFSAIYLSEYATKRFRSFAKPGMELLAGIPTIVYGLFALVTVGPILRDYFAQPLSIGTSANSVMAAGLVMGIMLIPFVSSLSDDIINAVPQNLRDGSYALGATKSETIKKVILPAALPGIVGAVLLATSRAVGETMIVVLGAGAAAKISGNPFEGMATITAKIVNQLTGDKEFESPETLVAFALGLTLFCITLLLNVLALQIVRKYREQYD